MSVYPVREDTLLVKRNLEEKNLKGLKFLEIGVGNAEISIIAAKKGAEVTAVDINKEAVEHAKKRFDEKRLEAEIFKSDLFEKVNGSYDFIVFNPPYLPGPDGLEDEEMWRGGEKGSEISKRYIENLGQYLNDKGNALLVLSSHTNFQELFKNYSVRELDRKKLWFETIFLFEFKKIF
jgi:release factor glutamine methyltransferase